MEQIFVWTLSDVLSLGLGSALALAGVFALAVDWYVKATCKHNAGVTETQACDAICRECGKNLGFIGMWRERHVD